MRSNRPTGLFWSTALVVSIMAVSSPAEAQDPLQRRPAETTATGKGLGLDLFGGAGLSWPAAKDSFEAVGLSSRAFDVGGGARVTGLFRGLFAQVAVARWSDTGERAFIGSDGTRFPLGIPLEVNATFIDATLGIKDATRTSTGRVSFLTYVGAGAGLVRYKEESPFAEPGDDLNTSKPSYHVLAGVEVPIAGWLALAVDGRYRYIPGLLGDGGASGVLEEDSLGGFQTSLGLRIGFGGPRPIAPAPPRSAPIVDTDVERPTAPASKGLPEGVITQAAPVFALPDSTRVPLRTLEAGTSVMIVEQKGDWVRVEFNDIQWGRRVGYVERKFVRFRQRP